MIEIGQFVNNRYRLVGILGEGGMATVYRAFDSVLHREVAIKVFHHPPNETASDLERYRREAQAIGSLKHKNIAEVYDAVFTKDCSYLVMELLSEKTILDLRDQGFQKLLEQLVSITDALALAHAKGFIHRDIKPSNIAITDDGQAKLLDFGLSLDLSRSRLTKSQMMMGTAAFVSPEQVLGNEVDFRSDLYSFGVLLYELFSGQLPFQSDNELGLLYATVALEPKDLNEVCPSLPVSLGRIIMRLLAKEPSERIGSAQHLRDILKQYVLAEDHPEAKISTPDLLPLYGRKNQWELLKKSWEASERASQICLLHGACDMGKTRLAREFSTFLAPTGCIVIFLTTIPPQRGKLSYHEGGVEEPITFEDLEKLVQCKTNQRFLVVIDEAHWLDAREIRKITAFAKSVPGIMMLICLESQAKVNLWQMEFADCRVINLNRLTRKDSSKLLSSFRKEPHEFETIYSKAQGVPGRLLHYAEYKLPQKFQQLFAGMRICAVTILASLFLFTGLPYNLLPENTTGLIRILGGSVNGNTITPENPTIIVEAGKPLAGTIEIETENFMSANAIAPFGYAWNSNDPEKYIQIDPWIPSGKKSWTVTIDSLAPAIPGSYWLIFAFAGEMELGDVFSLTNWFRQVPVWNDGMDIVDWTDSMLESTNKYGACCVDYRFDDVIRKYWVAGAGTRVVVQGRILSDPINTIDFSTDMGGSLFAPMPDYQLLVAPSYDQGLLFSTSDPRLEGIACLGIADLGDLGAVELESVPIPTSFHVLSDQADPKTGQYREIVPAIVGHTYVMFPKNNFWIVFRVLLIQNDVIQLRWLGQTALKTT